MKHYNDTMTLDHRVTQRFPREFSLPDVGGITITPLVPSDWGLLLQFLEGMGEEDRKYFRGQADDLKRVQRWCTKLDYEACLPLLAWRDGRIVADGVLQREVGGRVNGKAQVRLLVHPDFRQQGLGRVMVCELASVAESMGIDQLVYDCAAEQAGLIAFLRHCGFREDDRPDDEVADFARTVRMVRRLNRWCDR